MRSEAAIFPGYSHLMILKLELPVTGGSTSHRTRDCARVWFHYTLRLLLKIAGPEATRAAGSGAVARFSGLQRSDTIQVHRTYPPPPPYTKPYNTHYQPHQGD